MAHIKMSGVYHLKAGFQGQAGKYNLRGNN